MSYNKTRGKSPSIQDYFNPNFSRGSSSSQKPKKLDQITNSNKGHNSEKSIIEDDQILSITCMNCQELVPIEKINDHSVTCTNVPEIVKSIELGPYISQVIFKLKKLHTCLSDLHKNSDTRPGDKNYLNIFIRLCDKAINENSIDEIKSVMSSLNSLLLTHKGSLYIRILADRFLSLVQEQRLGLQEMEVDLKKKELDKIKEEVEKYKNRSNVLENKIVRKSIPDRKIIKKIDEINSALGSMQSSVSDFTVTSAVEEDKTDLFSDEMAISSENLQKHFYSFV